jgi:hypothetical protein
MPKLRELANSAIVLEGGGGKGVGGGEEEAATREEEEEEVDQLSTSRTLAVGVAC